MDFFVCLATSGSSSHGHLWTQVMTPVVSDVPFLSSCANKETKLSPVSFLPPPPSQAPALLGELPLVLSVVFQVKTISAGKTFKL